MKVMRKDTIIKKNPVDYMKAERDILTKVVLSIEDQAKVYTAEIVSAVSHLHKCRIVHRDLKPENILLDADGHIILTDFGLAKEIDESSRSHSICGTTEYMAPEILLSKGHNKDADWWSIGILLYEMLNGQLLQKEPSRRLGSGPGGEDEVKGRKCFQSVNWKKLEARELQPKYKPDVSGKDCAANFDQYWTTMPPDDSPAPTPTAGEHFQGYTYVAPNLGFHPDKLNDYESSQPT